MNASGQDALELAYGAVLYLQTLLDRRGKLELVDGQLLAGGVELSNATALVEEVKSKLGFGCSIFRGNLRIATTAFVADGLGGMDGDRAASQRAVGMHANEETTQQVYRCGERFTGIIRILRKSWVIVYAPLRDHQDKIVGMLAAYRELADFLHELKLLDGTTEALLLHSPDGRIIDANRTACDMLALSKPELLDKSMHELTATSQTALRAAWAEIDHEPIRLESFWRRADVFEFPVELSVSRATVSGVPLLLTIARDFTEQHAARERLRVLNAQLVQSEKMAALGKLVAGVAHDVNTPLGAIRSAQQNITKTTAKLRRTLGEHHRTALEAKGVARSMRMIEQ